MATPLDGRIAQIREKLAGLHQQREGVDRQIRDLTIELRAFEQAADLISQKPRPEKSVENASAEGGNRFQRTSLADAWDAAMGALRLRGREFTTDEIIQELEARGQVVKRAIARGRLSEFAAKGTIHRKRPGIFDFPTLDRVRAA